MLSPSAALWSNRACADMRIEHRLPWMQNMVRVKCELIQPGNRGGRSTVRYRQSVVPVRCNGPAMQVQLLRSLEMPKHIHSETAC